MGIDAEIGMLLAEVPALIRCESADRIHRAFANQLALGTVHGQRLSLACGIRLARFPPAVTTDGFHDQHGRPRARRRRARCTPITSDALGAEEAEGLVRAFKALSDPTRLRLISIVAGSEGEEACACDLIDPVGLGQPTVSHHLKILVEAGFLTRSNRGSWASHKLVPGSFDRVKEALPIV